MAPYHFVRSCANGVNRLPASKKILARLTSIERKGIAHAAGRLRSSTSKRVRWLASRLIRMRKARPLCVAALNAKSSTATRDATAEETKRSEERRVGKECR